MERVKGIEPSSQPWEGHILPLNHTRIFYRAVAQRAKADAQSASARPARSSFTVRQPDWTVFIRPRRGWQLLCASDENVQPRDGAAQFAGNLLQPLRFQDFAAVVRVAHVKIVNGRAALGDDARGGNVQVQFRERL